MAHHHHHQQQQQAAALPRWDPDRGLCAPLQNSLNDIPIIMYNVEGNAKSFKKFTRRRMDRALRLAPFVYYGRPVAPRAYPKDVHSHHIVRGRKASNQKHVIDFLISDVNQYYKGFRVGTLDAQGDYQWSDWFRFKGFPLPAFLGTDGVDIHIMSLDGGHSFELAVGGKTVMVSMFDSYVKHPTRALPRAELRKITGRTILVLCETMRFWSVYCGVIHGIKHDPSEVIPVGLKSNHRIGSWKVMCRFVLKVGRGGGVILAADLETVAVYGITRFRQLIAAGNKGELRLLLWEGELLCVGAVQKALEDPDAHRAENIGFAA